MAEALHTLRGFLALTKPRILLLVIFTGLPVMGMAAEGWPSASFAIATLTGIALAAGAANTLNCYLERDLDALMERTRSRPLPARDVAPSAALAFGLGLALISTLLLNAVGGPLTAALGVASILFYVFVYTVWLKPRSPLERGRSAAPRAPPRPLIADAALNGSVGAAGWLLFAIVFFWQPPHVWAIALFRKEDYARAGIPMLPNVIGDDPTRWRMLLVQPGADPRSRWPRPRWACWAPLYLSCAVALDAWFLWHVVRVVRERDEAAARRTFHVSLLYLFALFVGHAGRSGHPGLSGLSVDTRLVGRRLRPASLASLAVALCDAAARPGPPRSRKPTRGSWPSGPAGRAA